QLTRRRAEFHRAPHMGDQARPLRPAEAEQRDRHEIADPGPDVLAGAERELVQAVVGLHELGILAGRELPLGVHVAARLFHLGDERLGLLLTIGVGHVGESFGRPSPRTRSLMMLRWISLVPPAMVYCRALSTRLYQRGPSGTCSLGRFRSACGPSSSPAKAAVRPPSAEQKSCRMEPSGPGGSPRSCRVRLRMRVERWHCASITSWAKRWRISGLSHAGRPSSGTLPARARSRASCSSCPRPPPPLRSYISVVIAGFQPSFCLPMRLALGTGTSTKNTSLKCRCPFSSTSGRTVMPGVRIFTRRSPVPREVVAAILGARAEAREIRAGARLGVALAPDVVGAQDARQVAMLLFLAAPLDDGGARHGAAP